MSGLDTCTSPEHVEIPPLATTRSYKPRGVYGVVNDHKNDISATAHFLSTGHATATKLKHNIPKKCTVANNPYQMHHCDHCFDMAHL